MMFTTKSRDNDHYQDNCAVTFGAPWWFDDCHSAFLTGEYGQILPYARGITWKSIWGYYKFARFASMAIRANQ